MGLPRTGPRVFLTDIYEAGAEKISAYLCSQISRRGRKEPGHRTSGTTLLAGIAKPPLPPNGVRELATIPTQTVQQNFKIYRNSAKFVPEPERPHAAAATQGLHSRRRSPLTQCDVALLITCANLTEWRETVRNAVGVYSECQRRFRLVPPTFGSVPTGGPNLYILTEVVVKRHYE
jgi:hypothetical protein